MLARGLQRQGFQIIDWVASRGQPHGQFSETCRHFAPGRAIATVYSGADGVALPCTSASQAMASSGVQSPWSSLWNTQFRTVTSSKPGEASGLMSHVALPCTNTGPLSGHWASQFRDVASSAKPARDPDRPKRPTSGWMYFLQQYRGERKNAGETLKATEVMKAASTAWKEMPAPQRRPFEELAEADKRVYTKAMAEYVESGKKEAWKRDPDKPKRPMTSYMQFLKEFRASHAELKLTETSKLGGKAWKELTPQQREPYERQYEVRKQAYDEEMKKYTASGKEQVWKEKVGIAAQEKKLAEKAEKEKEKKQKEKEKKMKTKEKEKEKKQKEKEKAKRMKEKENEKKAKEKAKQKKQKE